MMSKSSTILTTPNSSSLNYQSLRTQGIETLQQIAGEVWADYSNLTDPGLKILDMLYDTMTDLTYRTNFPMADLLVNAVGLNRLGITQK